MRRHGRAGAAAAAAALACASAAVTATAPSPSLEEVLRDHQRLAAARVSPDGSQVLLALERQDRPSQGAPWRLANTETAVWRDGALTWIDAGDAGFKPTLCDPWSPSGRFVAGLTLRESARVAAAWDTRTGRAVVFPLATASMCLPWAGERLIVPVPPAADPGGGASRRLAADLQRARWERAWTGEAAEVTVHSNNALFPGPAAAPGRLELADPATGTRRLIAVGDFHSPTPSPDGRWLAAVELGPRDPDALFKRAGRTGRLVLFDLSGPAPRPVPVAADIDVDYGALAWDRASRRLMVGGRGRDRAAGFWILSPGGTVEPLALPPGVRPGSGLSSAFSTLRPFGWMGDRPAFVGTIPGRTLGRPADTAREHGDQGREALGLYVATRGGVRLLTGFTRQSVSRFAVTRQGEAIVVADGAAWRLAPGSPPRRLGPPGLHVVALAEERPTFGAPYAPQLPGARAQVLAHDGSGQLRLLGLDTASGRLIDDSDAEGVVALAPRGDGVVVQRWDGWSATLARVGAAPRELAQLNPAWRDRARQRIEPFDYTAGGRQLKGWIVLPPGAGAAPAPALVWGYGGASYPLRPPADALPGQSPTAVFSGQLWSAQGYAVIYPSTPLPAARDGDVAQALADATVAAVDAAAARGWIDPQRVGLIGHSFGGFSVAAILSRQSDRFRAAVAMSGPYDFAAGWGARRPLERMTDADDWTGSEETRGTVEEGQIGLGVPPFVDGARYLGASPLYAADRIRTPLLLTAGDFDHGGAGLEQAERLYAALVRAGNPAVMVRYWGQDHVQDDPWAVRDQWRRFTGWFANYLGPDTLSAAAAPPSPNPAPAPASTAPRPPS